MTAVHLAVSQGDVSMLRLLCAPPAAMIAAGAGRGGRAAAAAVVSTAAAPLAAPTAAAAGGHGMGALVSEMHARNQLGWAARFKRRGPCACVLTLS